MRGRIRASSAVTWSCAPASRSAPSRTADAAGSSRAACAAGSRASSAVTWSCAPASRSAPSRGRRRPGRRGRRGRRRGRQRGDLVLRARLPQRRPAGGDAERVVEGGVRGRIRASSAVTWSCAPASRRPPSRSATPDGLSRAAWAAARSASAVTWSCAPASRSAAQQDGDTVRVVEGGVRGGAGTGQQRGDLVLRARLPQRAQQAADAAGSSRAACAAGSRASSAVTWSCAPASRSAPSRHGDAARVVEGGVRGGPLGGAMVGEDSTGAERRREQQRLWRPGDRRVYRAGRRHGAGRDRRPRCPGWPGPRAGHGGRRSRN